MKTIKGPAIFLAQFAGDEEPFNTWENACKWAAELGYKGIQLPSWETRYIDLEKAANSISYAEELKSIAGKYGIVITELSTHIQGQLVAAHPAYDSMFDGFVGDELKGNPEKRQVWAVEQLKLAAKACKNLGLNACATFSGALMWHTVYPWPQRPEGLVELGFTELAKLWKPILNEYQFQGVDLCFELHPGEDLHDGVSFDRFLAAIDGHKAANILYDPSHFLLQQMDYLQFIDIYHDRIKMFHVKDAEFNPTGRSGVYGGYQEWVDRPGRFRSLGDGQVDFRSIFSRLTQYGYEGWAVVEWECCMKNQCVGAKEGVEFVNRHIIPVTKRAFDDFAGDDKIDLNGIIGLKK